jgi:hypothetical protein
MFQLAQHLDNIWADADLRPTGCGCIPERLHTYAIENYVRVSKPFLARTNQTR